MPAKDFPTTTTTATTSSSSSGSEDECTRSPSRSPALAGGLSPPSPFSATATTTSSSASSPCFKLKTRRNRASWEQRMLLEKVFQSIQYPDMSLRTQLGVQLGMTPRKVQIWFQNRRTKLKNKEGNSLAMLRNTALSTELINQIISVRFWWQTFVFFCLVTWHATWRVIFRVPFLLISSFFLCFFLLFRTPIIILTMVWHQWMPSERQLHKHPYKLSCALNPQQVSLRCQLWEMLLLLHFYNKLVLLLLLYLLLKLLLLLLLLQLDFQCGCQLFLFLVCQQHFHIFP